MVHRETISGKVIKNLIIGVLVGLGSTACATSSVDVKTVAAPITYKIDGQVGQYASLKRDVNLGNSSAQSIQRPSYLTMEQVQRPRVSQPSVQGQSFPHIEFNARTVDKDLYAHQRVGKRYTIAGKSYTPKHEPKYDTTGLASWYGPKFNGKPTATGEVFDMTDLTAAHKTLPLNSMVHVTNLENGRTLMVRVNDRGPFVGTRIIDLSKASAEYLGTIENGLAKVRVRYAGPADTNAPKRMYNAPKSAPAPLVAARPAPVRPVQRSAPRPQQAAPQPQTDYVPLRQLGQQVAVPPAAAQPTPRPVAQAVRPAPAPAPIYEPQPQLQLPPPPAPVAVAEDRLAPIVPPRPEAGGNVTLTIKGPIHMATQTDQDPKPRWIPAVNRIETTKQP
ncbi:MAG: septal ring lytic transglycosylase RlpA family protein [Maricaulaceae bacterium]